MAKLTIRNLTASAVTLKRVERFNAKQVSTGSTLGNAVGTITSMLNATNFNTTETRPEGDARDKKDVDVKLGSFSAPKATEIEAAQPDKEVLRLQFEIDGKKYQVDTPSHDDSSTTLEPLSKDDKASFTAVYVQQHSFLALFSSSNLNAWMKELSDGWLLSSLSIPGTHNSPTCFTALPSVRCQAVTVREQLDNGVRFMDIRVSATPENDDLALVHSAFPIALTGTKWFADMLGKEVYPFLDKNPSETVIISLKREGTGKASDKDLSRYVRDRYVKKDAKRWYTGPEIPKLGDARGKVVLMRRFALDDAVKKSENGGKGFGVDAARWPDNCDDGTCGGGAVRVQDFYEVDQSTNIDKKVGYSHAHLERAAEALFHPAGSKDHKKDAPFFVNFLSASNFFNATCWPERIAAKVNPSVVEYLCMVHGEDGKGPKKLKAGDASTGIVVTDWVGAHDDWDLIRCIVGWNARLQLKK